MCAYPSAVSTSYAFHFNLGCKTIHGTVVHSTALAFVHPDVAGLMCSIGNSSAAPLAKFAVSFPLLYHWLGGLRHTVWDKVNLRPIGVAIPFRLLCYARPRSEGWFSMRREFPVCGIALIGTKKLEQITKHIFVGASTCARS